MQTYNQLQASGKGNLIITEIAKEVRNRLKEALPSCNFSVVTEKYSMGRSLHVYLLKSHYNAIKRFEEISDVAILYKGANRYTKEDIKKIQADKYHQLNHFCFLQEYKPNEWGNGVFLTEKGHKIFKKAMEIIEDYHYDNSDSMTDYSDTNFYIHLYIGKFDKDYSYNEELIE